MINKIKKLGVFGTHFALLTPLLALFAASPAQAEDVFWPHWGDGQAELNGYVLTQPRYGEARAGRAVLVFVTEPFWRSKHVKANTWDPKNPDLVQVLKLNAIRRFQTGIYDYSVMTSTFVEPGAGFRPLAVTFTAQDWCGHTFEAWRRTGDDGALAVHSYFEGETGQTRLPADAWPEDALLMLARQLDQTTLDTEPRTLKMVAGALHRRLNHLPAQPAETTLSWSPDARTRHVPAGDFSTRSMQYTRNDGTGCTLHIEVPAPHRLIGWDCTGGERAELTGSLRSPYWRQHAEGDEALLAKLGLPPLVDPKGPRPVAPAADPPP
jgi:hypothetical protein